MSITDRVAQALNLLEQLEQQHAMEDGLIDPDDWDAFTAGDLLRVARGETSIQAMLWGDDRGIITEESEREALARWNAAPHAERASNPGAQAHLGLMARVANANTGAEPRDTLYVAHMTPGPGPWPDGLRETGYVSGGMANGYKPIPIDEETPTDGE